jgi:SAM-dependent methyltransferase
MNNHFSRYADGHTLYGDDFSDAEISQWFADEKEGYADLGAKNTESYVYAYHQLNQYHGFQYLQQAHYKNALGFGSAYGDEFLPIKDKIAQLTIIDPSSAFANIRNVHDIPCKYAQPHPSGDMAFNDNSFDLIICLGVLHHIPNVSHVLKECFRCLESGGMMLIREPIISMGDWSKPRAGLTKRERGIPLQVFEKIIAEAGFCIIHKAPCMFPLTAKIASILGILPFNNALFTRLDTWLCKLFTWNLRYHPQKRIHKLRPTSAYFVLLKK